MQNWFSCENSLNKSPQFLHLCDPQYIAEKELLQKWIDRFTPTDHLNKVIHQFQTSFRSVFWELYLSEIFQEEGMEIIHSGTSPDFELKKKEKTFFVEAVTANFSQSELSEEYRTLSDINGENDIYPIIDKSIIRVSNAISNKFNEFNKTYSLEGRLKNHPYIIAVYDCSQINYGQVGFYSLLALLYRARFDPDDKLDLQILCNDEFYTEEYKYQESISKDNGSPIPLGLFCDENYSDISAILFTCTLTLGKLSSLVGSCSIPRSIIIERKYPESGTVMQFLRYSGSSSDEFLGDGLFLFINNYAKNPIHADFLEQEGINIISYDSEENVIRIRYCGKKIPNIFMRRYVNYPGEEIGIINPNTMLWYKPVR